MPKYDYYPDDDGFDDHLPLKTKPQVPHALKRKRSFPYGVHRRLIEPQRPVVTEAIRSALSDHPVPKFRSSPNDMIVTILTPAQSMAACLDRSPRYKHLSLGRQIMQFNEPITDFIEQANQERPSFSAAPSDVERISFKTVKRSTIKYMAGMRLVKGQTREMVEEQLALRTLVIDLPNLSLMLPTMSLGYSDSNSGAEEFANTMNQAHIADSITAALRSDANPDGLLEFGPLESRIA